MPQTPAPDRRWYAVSAVVHAVAVVVLVVFSSRTFSVERIVTMIPLDTVGSPLVFPTFTPERVSKRPASEKAPGPALNAPAALPARDTVVAVVPNLQVAAAVPPPPRDTLPRRPAPQRADQGKRGTGGRSDSASARVGTHRLLGPGLTVQNRPIWSGARQLALAMLRAGQEGAATPAVPEAAPLDSAQRREKMDSVVKERLRQFMAALPPDSMAAPKAQSWTDTINGKPWGMDGQWIYLGDIKIPTAILALLPLPSGNYDQAQQAKSLQYMRDDILQAAQHAQNNADFQRYLKEERARHDAERAAEQARKAQMPKDTVIKQ